MIQIDPTIVYVLMGVAFVGLLLAAAAVWVMRQTNKDVQDGTPPEIVGRILDLADTLAKLALPAATLTETLDDDALWIKYLTTRGFKVTGNPETGYQVSPPDAPPS